MQYQGVVQEVSSFDYMGKKLWSLQLNGTRGYFRCGESRPQIQHGDYITFQADPGKNGSFNVVKGTIGIKAKEAEATGVSTAVSNAKPTGVSKDDYWANREARDVAVQQRIELQSCRNSAIEFVKILLDKEALKVPAKNKVEFLEELLEHYIEDFLARNNGEKKEPEITGTKQEIPKDFPNAPEFN